MTICAGSDTYDVLFIEAWRDLERKGSWCWRESQVLQRGVSLDAKKLGQSEMVVARHLLTWLRKEDYLAKSNGHGYLTVVKNDNGDYEVLRRQDEKPLFVFQKRGN